MAQILFIVAPEKFRDEELFEPQKVLVSAGHTTTIASLTPGTCYGRCGGTVEAVIGLNQVNAEDFDAIVFVGGSGSHEYFDHPAAHLLCQRAVAAGKILAAICAAPSILAKAGVLQGHRVTCFADEEYYEILRTAGAERIDAPVVVDGRLVTADGPESAKAFGEAIAVALSHHSH